LGDLQLLFTADGHRIEWRFITELEKLQSSEQLHLANKITKEHIQFQKKKDESLFGNTGAFSLSG
jgi:hypothetical protein